MRSLSLIFCLIVALALAACNPSPVVLVATALPPDANFRSYRHPSGVFTLRLPPDWSVRDVSQGGALRVEFSPPNITGLPVTVYVINTGTMLSAAGLLDIVDRYQRTINGDPDVYHEISRNAQGDGSWRLVGIRQTPIGPRQLNTFVQADGTYLSVVEADLTGLDNAALQTLRIVINTLRVDPSAIIPASDLQAAPQNINNMGTGVLTFDNLYAWTTASGVFVINGTVTNQSSGPLEAIRITALLYDAQNAVMLEETNVVPVEVLGERSSAPFSIRFRTGKPSQTLRYDLHAAARNAEYALQTYMGDDKFIKGNDRASYNANGFLTVTGDVVNQTQGAAYFVKAIVTVYDEESRVVAVDTVFLNKNRLLPGEVGRFEITFPELGGNAMRYIITVEGKSRPVE